MDSKVKDVSNFDDSCRFVYVLVEACQVFGVSSHSMVSELSRIVKGLGLRGTFIANPNYVQTVLWGDDEHQQRVHLAVSRSGNYDLNRLGQVWEIANRVAAGTVSPAEGLKEMKNLVLAPGLYGPLWTAIAFACCSASFAVILGGSWKDAVSGGLVSMVSYAISLLAARSAGVAILQELLASTAAALLASMASTIWAGVNPMAVTVSAVVWFIPGFGLAMAPRELMVGSTLSGLTWLTNAVVVGVKLFVGAALGFTLAGGNWIQVAPLSSSAMLSSFWSWGAAAVFVLGMAVLFKVNWRDFGGALIGGLLVWSAEDLGEPYGYWQGTFLGSIVLVAYSRWYARRFGRLSSVIALPCVMLLLPGLSALRALYDADTLGINAGVQSGYRVIVLIAAILGGTIVGDALSMENLARTGRTMGQALRALVGRQEG